MAALCTLLLASSCGRERVETRASELSLHYLEGCAPEQLDQLTIEALGDYPPSQRSIVSFDARRGPATLADLPYDARLFRVNVITPRFRGAALAPAGDGVALPALVLPEGVHCSVRAEPALPDLTGAALALVGGRDLLIAGGWSEDGEAAHREAVLLEVETQQARRVAAGLFVPRADACAVAVAQETWVIGGAQGARAGSPGLDTFERFDGASGEFVGLGRLASPRTGARAVLLLDGTVLLAGGRSAVDGDLLTTLERIDPERHEGNLLAAHLPWPAEVRALSVRDDGQVVIAVDAPDGPGLALFDPRAETVDEVHVPDADWDPGLVAALPGARVALLEARDGATTGALWLLLPNDRYVKVERWLTSFEGLSDARVSVLPEGRLLLTGLLNGAPTARVIDPGRSDVRVRALTEPPVAHHLRADGSVLEVGRAGVQIVREEARTAYDNPGGTLLAEDTSVLALDAPGHWRREGLSLVSEVPFARFDISVLRYERVRLVVRVEGPSELLLRHAGGAERLIELGEARAGPAFCGLEADPAQPVTLERDGSSLRVRTSEGARRCTLEGLEGPIALGLRAIEPGVRVHALEAARY